MFQIINTTWIVPIAQYIEKTWVESKDSNFTEKQILARGMYLTVVPASFIACAVDIIVGLGIGLGAIGTLGMHRPLLAAAYTHLKNSKFLLSWPYVALLKAINPKAEFPANLDQTYYSREFLAADQPMISCSGEGLISNSVIEPIKNIATECYNSHNFLKRHVASRLTYGLLALSCLVTRAVDGMIGIPAAALSILTFGKFGFLNNLAYRGLQTSGIIGDLFYCTVKCINPFAGTITE